MVHSLALDEVTFHTKAERSFNHVQTIITWQLFPINGSFYDPRITALIVTLVAFIVTVVWGPETLENANGRKQSRQVPES